jgi:hypothetical protein
MKAADKQSYLLAEISDYGLAWSGLAGEYIHIFTHKHIMVKRIDVAQAVKILICILEDPGSNLGWNNNYPEGVRGFTQFIQKDVGIAY